MNRGFLSEHAIRNRKPLEQIEAAIGEANHILAKHDCPNKSRTVIGGALSGRGSGRAGGAAKMKLRLIPGDAATRRRRIDNRWAAR